MPKLSRRRFLVAAGVTATCAALEACRSQSIVQITATPPPTPIPDPTQPPVQEPEMVLVEPGTFMMGTDSHTHRDERPAFPVRITTPYYIAKYPVTFDDYDLVFMEKPDQFRGPNIWLGDWDNQIKEAAFGINRNDTAVFVALFRIDEMCENFSFRNITMDNGLELAMRVNLFMKRQLRGIIFVFIQAHFLKRPP